MTNLPKITLNNYFLETRQIDLFFSPNAEQNRNYLGLLGRIVLNTVLIEPYRNPPNRSEIRNCLQ